LEVGSGKWEVRSGKWEVGSGKASGGCQSPGKSRAEIFQPNAVSSLVQFPMLNTWEVPFRAAGRESAGKVRCSRVWERIEEVRSEK
jgi:hypothetical protein